MLKNFYQIEMGTSCLILQAETKQEILADKWIALAVQTGRGKDQARVQLLMDEADIDRGLLNSIFDRYSLDKRWIPWTT